MHIFNISVVWPQHGDHRAIVALMIRVLKELPTLCNDRLLLVTQPGTEELHNVGNDRCMYGIMRSDACALSTLKVRALTQ